MTTRRNPRHVATGSVRLKELSQQANAARKAAAARRRPPAPVDYPPGHFTAPVYAWWPDWQPYVLGRFDTGAAERSARAAAVTEENRRLNRGFGNGTMDLPRTPDSVAPGWI